MPQLDPRHRPFRLVPVIAMSAAVVFCASVVWRMVDPAEARMKALDPKEAIALESRALAHVTTRPGFGAAEDIAIILRKGETLQQAVARTGISQEDAKLATALLAGSYNINELSAGASFETAIARPSDDASKPAQLLGLTLRTGPAKQLALTTSRDGQMRLRTLEEQVHDERRIAIGRFEGSMFTSAAALGATPSLTNQVMKLFAHKIDFERDLKTGDSFKMVFDRRVTQSGRTVESGNLLYAEIEAKGRIAKFYSFRPTGSDSIEYFDESGKNIKGFLMATPIVGVRSNSGYGMRLHPILGFMQMHTGIDFAAPSGTPIQAAGNGVVSESRWWGGYGKWVRIDHGSGWSTGYAHLSQISVRPGERVKQGQIIGLVGTTGRSTGPHLHFEVWRNNRPIDPRSANVPQGTMLARHDLQAFQARKNEIDVMIDMAGAGNGDALNPSTTVALARVSEKQETQNNSPNAVALRKRDWREPATTSRGMG